MRSIKATFVALVSLIGIALGAGPALAWGNSTGCRSYEMASHSTGWGFFFGHSIRTYDAACIKVYNGAVINFEYLKWVRTPILSFPSRTPIPNAETIKVTRQPYVSNVIWNSYGKATLVRWSFSLHQCSAPLSYACNDFDFIYRVTPYWTQICAVGGSCDSEKYW